MSDLASCIKPKEIELSNTCCVCGKVETYRMAVSALIMGSFERTGFRTTFACDDCKADYERKRENDEKRNIWLNACRCAGIPGERIYWRRDMGNMNLMKWIADNRESSLLIQGSYDTGKTWACCGFLARILKENPDSPVRYFNAAELYDRYLENLEYGTAEANKFIDGLTRYDILVIDDLGKQKITAACTNFFYRLFDKLDLKKDVRLWITANKKWSDFYTMFECADSANAILSRIVRWNNAGRLKKYEV